MESPEGRFILENPVLCQMLGRDAPTLMAATWRDVTHPDDVSVGEGLLNDLVAGTISSFRVRKRYLKPDGSVLWGDLSISCVRNDDGSVRNFIVQIMDISEQVQAEQSLAESEEQYRLLAENASDVVMRLSLNRRYEWASGSVEDVLGWKAPDLLGHCIDEFIHPDDLVRFRQVVADAGLRTAASVEFRFRRSDHTYRWVACRTRVKVDEDGTPVSVVGGLVDIEDRKAAETEEQERLAQLEQFQRLTVGRELRMIELKKEIEYLTKYGPVNGREPGDEYWGMSQADEDSGRKRHVPSFLRVAQKLVAGG